MRVEVRRYAYQEKQLDRARDTVQEMRQRNYWEDEGISYDDAELSEYAEFWMNRQEEMSTKPIYCGHCSSNMSLEILGHRGFQMVCSHCGTSGPRGSDRTEAFALARAIFSD